MHTVSDTGDTEVVDQIAKVTHELCSDLSRVASHWFTIGVLLGVNVSKLREFSGKDIHCLRSMIERRLNDYPDLRVHHIVEATAHPAGGNNPALAHTIAKKYSIISAE